MATRTESEVQELQTSALEHLWVYLREPSEMAEKGEPQIFVEGKGCKVTDALGNTYIDAMSGLWLKNIGYGRTASDEARWISGVTLPVDAGLLAATPLAMYPYLSEPE